MKINRVLLASLLLSPVLSLAQGGGVTQSDLLKPLKDSWPTYNGDYSGKRYSALTQVNRSNVQHLTLAWMTRMTPGIDKPENLGRHARTAAPVIVGGEGPGDIAIQAAVSKHPSLKWMARCISQCLITRGR